MVQGLPHGYKESRLFCLGPMASSLCLDDLASLFCRFRCCCVTAVALACTLFRLHAYEERGCRSHATPELPSRDHQQSAGACATVTPFLALPQDSATRNSCPYTESPCNASKPKFKCSKGMAEDHLHVAEVDHVQQPSTLQGRSKWC